MWLPGTGLSISEVFNRILHIIEKHEVNAVFVIDEIDYLAELIQKTGKDVLYQITRANERLEHRLTYPHRRIKRPYIQREIGPTGD